MQEIGKRQLLPKGKEAFMKRKIAITLVLTMLLASVCLTLSGISASAGFGSGMKVVSSEVNMIKTGLVGKRIVFSDADFKSALCISDFDSLKITKIPSSTDGSLLLDGRRVGEGKVIKRRNIGSLVFMPASESVSECAFSFTVEGYGSGEEIECILKFIDKVNYRPEATDDTEAVALKTQESISLFGKLYGSDPEGDQIKFIVVSYPKNGTLEITDEEGRYCYTPNDEYVGMDKFTYVVRDEYGNYSYPETVSVKVNQRMCETVYRDMIGRSEYNAAVAMTAMNIMGGQILGDDVYFMPDREVNRAEFVAMAMKCAGIRVDSSLSASYFDDDADIPESLKPYVATAQRVGIVNGDFKDGQLLFSPNESLTKYEAAKIMAAILGADGENEESVFNESDEVPVWARAGVSAMYTLGIFEEEDQLNPKDNVTRANVAQYLYRLEEVK